MTLVVGLVEQLLLRCEPLPISVPE